MTAFVEKCNIEAKLWLVLFWKRNYTEIINIICLHIPWQFVWKLLPIIADDQQQLISISSGYAMENVLSWYMHWLFAINRFGSVTELHDMVTELRVWLLL